MNTFPLRALVLEDHPFQRAYAVKVLRHLGCTEIFEAEDGEQALALLQQVGAVDITLCDLQMNGMDGLEFLQQASHSNLVGAIIISSSMSSDLRCSVQKIVSLLGMRLLGDAGKPLRPETLLPLLEKHSSITYNPLSRTAAPELPDRQEVAQALQDHQIKAYYQPKINLHTGQIYGVEVLTRWLHPVKGVLTPASFMPTLERCGLMDELLFDQLNQALKLQKQVLEKHISLNFAFNLQTSQLAGGQLSQRVKSKLDQFDLPGSGLTFELTEGGLLEAAAESIETLVRLRMMGCQLSIDDFGSGFSSMQRLCQLPFNEIKLDIEFVRTLQEQRCQTVISSILTLGQSLGMSVVAEGIETPEQRDKLLDLGCSRGQGYLYARPMSGADLLSWLPRHLSAN
jgi:EAL domain-containing protein (putative c-di-GMP-specific phosphodiesterase class I)/AmiR/NasT family two-component response regulator